jgi:hypothetical protein
MSDASKNLKILELPDYKEFNFDFNKAVIEGAKGLTRITFASITLD